LDGAGQVRRSTQSRTEGVGELGKPLPGEVIRRRGLDQSIGIDPKGANQ
jgi:hypothetical protein